MTIRRQDPRLGADPAFIPQTLLRMARSLERLNTNLSNGVVPREDLVIAELASSTVAVNADQDFDLALKDDQEQTVRFSHLSITQVDIDSPQLAAGDTVTLNFYRRARRTSPTDLVAQFTGASQISGMWVASFSNRRIEYYNLDKKSLIHCRVTNASGNSGPATFHVIVHARRFPIAASSNPGE